MKQQVKIISPNSNNDILDSHGILPVRGSEQSAGYDLSSPKTVILEPGKVTLIMTNVAIAWDDPNYFMKLESRSGLAKKGIIVTGGIIDFDYQKNIGVLLFNTTDKPFPVDRGDRIAQYIYYQINNPEFEMVEEFTIDPKSTRDGGFGSTGYGELKRERPTYEEYLDNIKKNEKDISLYMEKYSVTIDDLIAITKMRNSVTDL